MYSSGSDDVLASSNATSLRLLLERRRASMAFFLLVRCFLLAFPRFCSRSWRRRWRGDVADTDGESDSDEFDNVEAL